MNVILLLSVLGGFEPSVSVVASTPAEAVKRLARIEDDRDRTPIIAERAFDGLPRPARGIEYRATRRRSRSDKLRVAVEATQRGQRVARRVYAFAWRTKVAVVVPAHDIGPGETVRASDLELREIETRRRPDRMALAPEQLVGRIAKAPLTRHHPVMLSDVVLPQVVKRGDKITVRAHFGAMTVTLSGYALEDGAVGDEIRIRNDKSKKTLSAVVIDHGAAEISP